MKRKYLYLKHMKASFIICLLLKHSGALAEEIRIFDSLGPEKVNEVVSITLGDDIKTIEINQENPQEYAQFACPNGKWPYSVETTTTLYRDGKSFLVHGRTSGLMDCNGNVDFDLIGDYSLYGVLITLQNKQITVSPPDTYQPTEDNQTDSNDESAGNNSSCRQVLNPAWKPVSIAPIDSSHPFGFSVSTENKYILKCTEK
jgi:hypothetical protein